jgi:NodT family efflux transporter outer membrane factor (OMF) lipoprotein
LPADVNDHPEGTNTMNIVDKKLCSAGLAAFVTSLAGCATVPDLGRAPSIRPASELATSRSLSTGSAQWPTDSWWLTYNDATLTKLIEEGLSGSPGLAIAQARFRAANAVVSQARAAQLPQVNAQVSGGVVKQSYNNGIPANFIPKGWNESGSVGVGLNFDLDLWGGKRAGARAALSDADAAALEVEQARLVLATGIADAYAQLVQLNVARQVADAGVTLRSDTEKLVRSRVVGGLDTEADLAQAQAAVPAARGDVLAIDEAIVTVRHQIAALMGQGPDRGLDIVIGSTPPVIHDLPAGITTDLIGRRPDIRASLARVGASDSRIRVAKAAFYPSINISALTGFQALGLGNVFNLGTMYGNAGPAISLPIFDGGAIAGRYAQSRAGYDEAVATYDRAVVDAYREVADVVAARQSLVARLNEASASLAQSERGYAIARQRFQGGLSAYLDVLTAQQGVLVARRSVAELTTRGFSLDVALVRALGGGFGAAATRTAAR